MAKTSTRSNGRALTVSKVKSKLKRGAKPALAFLGSATFIEMALIAGAGFVVWKNRDRIQAYLDEKGIDIPGSVSEKFSQWFGHGSAEGERDRSYTQ